ncbi:hypothetical protein [Tessaracoccus antarcticus]|uniref:Adhesin domain-containing protein n=1 Tax=Tessaracoccus antarcticus TaxID=2479848 RepID=A0A3M0GBC8_9ACTN|nr:hypothetical protein [Tessaracoccus antarcticus]RMB62200.1 hypothetical protein EAX62_06455 [Tessaracoccus antarcticus]
MSNVDLGPILDDLAAGRIDAAEASRRIDELKSRQTGEQDADSPKRAKASRDQGPRTGGLTKVAITSVGRRVRVEGDPSVSTLVVEGRHVLRRNGTVMEVSSTGEFGPSFQGFSLIRPPRSLDDFRDIGLGKELLVRVNPNLVVDVEVTTGGLKTTGVPRLGRIRVTAGGCTLEGVDEVGDLLAQAGGVTLEGPISTGRSRVKVESGSLSILLTHGANVTVRGEARLGRITWPDDNAEVDEFIVGNGSARLDVSVVMGMATIKVED